MQPDVQSIENAIGPRGTATIASANRNLVRRWLCARGVDSPTARGMTLDQLRETYNDTSDETLREYRDNGHADELKTTAPPRKHFSPAPDKPDTATATDSDNPEIRQLAGLLQNLLAGQRQSLDENRVIELIEQHADSGTDESAVIDLIRKHAPITSVEIKRPGRDPKTIKGHHHSAFPDLLKIVSAGCNVWLSGPAGSGKTTLAHQCADALELPFYSTGAVTSDFRLMGFVNAQGDIVRTPFREAFEHGGVFLWDEIDASNPNALTAFNQALANGHFAFPDGMVEKHENFIAIAAANTYGHGPSAEYVGRTRIDAATLDRFVTLYIDYDEKLERALAGPDYSDWVDTVQTARRVVRDNGIKHIISPRAVVEGARLLSAGVDQSTVTACVLRKGLDVDSWNKVKGAI